MSRNRPAIDLAALLDARELGREVEGASELDVAILEEDYEYAWSLYQRFGDPVEDAKFGFARLFAEGEDPAGLLNLSNVGPHMAARAVLAYKIARESDQPGIPAEALQLMEDDPSVPLASPIWYQVALLLQICFGADVGMGTPLNAAGEGYAEHDRAPESLLFHLADALMQEGTYSESVAHDLALAVQESDDVDVLKAGVKWGLLFGDADMTCTSVDALLDDVTDELCEHDEWNRRYLHGLNVLANRPDDREECEVLLEDLSDRDASVRTLVDRVVIAALAAGTGDQQRFLELARDALAFARNPELPKEARGEVVMHLHSIELGFLSDPRPFIPGHKLFDILHADPMGLTKDEHIELCAIAAVVEQTSQVKGEATRAFLLEHATDRVAPCFAPEALAWLIGNKEIKRAGELLARIHEHRGDADEGCATVLAMSGLDVAADVIAHAAQAAQASAHPPGETLH